MLAGGRLIRILIDGGTWLAYRDNVRITSDMLNIGPNSVDVSLGRKFLVPERRENPVIGYFPIVDPDAADDSRHRANFREVETDELIVYPRDFILACTAERIDCAAPVFINEDTSFIPLSDHTAEHYFAPMYEGRSTFARLGLASHVTAGFGDYGFNGYWTLELYNCGPFPIRLKAGFRIGQLYFVDVKQPLEYTGGYKEQHEAKPYPPVIGKDRV